jgi:hypothetical protein
MRKTIVAMFALAAVGVIQPTAVCARGGMGGFGAGGGYPASFEMLLRALVAWFRNASRRGTAGVSDKFRSAISRRQQSERARRSCRPPHSSRFSLRFPKCVSFGQWR